MPRFIWSAVFIFFVSFFAGCGGKDSASNTPADAPAAPVEIPVTDDGGTQLVQMTGGDNMHFNGTRFTVVTGKPVRIELTNIGQHPRIEMAHNVVILQPGTDAEGFALSAAEAKAENFLPSALMHEVVASTPFAGPGEVVTVAFTAPVPGEYPFLCTFPGHYVAGMHGQMVVVTAK